MCQAYKAVKVRYGGRGLQLKTSAAFAFFELKSCQSKHDVCRDVQKLVEMWFPGQRTSRRLGDKITSPVPMISSSESSANPRDLSRFMVPSS